MDATEIDEWRFYLSTNPHGEERADLRNAMLCSLIHNQNVPKEKKHLRTSYRDFMPFAKKEEKSMDSKELKNFFENLKLQQRLRKEREHNDRSSPH